MLDKAKYLKAAQEMIEALGPPLSTFKDYHDDEIFGVWYFTDTDEIVIMPVASLGAYMWENREVISKQKLDAINEAKERAKPTIRTREDLLSNIGSGWPLTTVVNRLGLSGKQIEEYLFPPNAKEVLAEKVLYKYTKGEISVMVAYIISKLPKSKQEKWLDEPSDSIAVLADGVNEELNANKD